MAVERLSLKQLLDAIASLDVEHILVDVERDGRSIVLPPAVLTMFAGSDGKLDSPADASGRLPVLEQNSPTTLTQAQYTTRLLQSMGHPGVGARPYTSVNDAANAEGRYGIYSDIMLEGGSVANHKLVDKVAGYRAVVALVSLWSDTAQTYTLALQDEDNAACELVNPFLSVRVPTAGDHIPLYGIVARASADDKDLEVDIGGGAGAEALNLTYIYWYET